VPEPIVAHALDFVPLIPIPIAIVALMIYARRQRQRGDQPREKEPEGLAALADLTLLGIRTLRDRFRGSSGKDKPKES
jgi:hypothetical protein